jgi:HEAT repeat protein
MSIHLNHIRNQLESAEVGQRSQAVLQLQPGNGFDDQAITLLVNIICTEADLNVVEDATWVLVRHGQAATTALLDVLPHPEARIRHNIVHTLGKLADADAVPALVEATNDPDPTVRLKAVYALGQVGDPRALAALVARLDDPTQNVSWTAREVIEGFGEQAMEHLIAALNQPSVQVRELAVSLLGEIGGTQAVEALATALHTEDWQIRVAVLEALSQINDPGARAIIAERVSDLHPAVRALATSLSQPPEQPRPARKLAW